MGLPSGNPIFLLKEELCMSNIFSASNLLESNFSEPTATRKINIEESYFIAALNYMEEMNTEIGDINKKLYMSILEAGDDPIVINESFSSFCKAIRNVIDKFLAFLKRIVQKFTLTINKLVKSDKYIDKHKSELSKFGADQSFEMKVFKFTHLTDDDVPKLQPLDEWQKGIGYSNHSSYSDKDSLLTNVTNVYNNLKGNDTGWYDNFRGTVINKDNTSISAEDFAGELFELFRDGSKEKYEEEFYYDGVNEAYNRFKSYKTNLDDVDKKRKQLDKDYGEIKTEIGKWSTNSVTGKSPLDIIYGNDAGLYTVDYEEDKANIDAQINLFVKTKLNQIDHMCRIHLMAFAAKLDAIKDCYKQDKEIIYKALSKVQKIK